MEKKLSFRNIDYEQDVDEIVRLLRGSLSDSHTPQLFKWKHYENPFGKSYGLLACDQEKIVGVRMFMFWQFRKKEQVIRSIRPVDTIVDPSYRGRGLFNTLTLKGLESCEDQYDLVFNTPNQNSLPGYLKMGWKQFSGKFDYNVALLVPPLWWSDANVEFVSINDVVVPSYNSTDFFQTEKTSDFLRWRYGSNQYRVARITGPRTETTFVFRIEKLKGLRTIVIMEVIGENEAINLQGLKHLVRKLKIFVVYFLSSEAIQLPLTSRKSSSSIVVYKEDRLNVRSEIKFSAGDLEGKL